MKKEVFAVDSLLGTACNSSLGRWALCSILGLLCLSAHAQNTVFTYQGRVTSNGTNFSGMGQFKFALVTGTNATSTATATANPPSGGFITIINVTFGGSGYPSAPAVTISGGGGSGATAHANISGGVVTGIFVDNPGSGYTSTPSVTIAPPPPNISFTTYWSNDGASVNGSEPVAAVNVSVNNGLFVAVIGETAIPNMAALPASVFAQPNLQLRIWFNDGVSGFAPLSPPQELTPTPYAVRALNANTAATATTAATALSANSVAATNISGPISLSQLQGPIVTNNQSGVNLNGSFGGNGGALSNVSANSLVLSSPTTGVIAWGDNQYGERNVPAGLIDVAAVAGSLTHALALKSNGTVVAWGAGTTIDPSNQVESGQSIVPTGLVAKAIGAGYLHSIALKFDGTVVAWGAGMTNNPDDGINFGQSIVPAGLTSVRAISAGVIHNLALKSNGTVVAWGGGFTNDPNNIMQSGQSAVPPGLTNVIAVSAGYAHSLALRANGTVVAWGAGTTFNPTNGAEYGQSMIPAGLSNVTAISAGAVHSLALKSDGTVVAWGAGGIGATNSVDFGQSIVPAGLSNVIAIAAGVYHSVALKSDGTVVVWGDNQFGEANVPPGLKNVLALAPGSIFAGVMVIRVQSTAPVAWLDSDNTFNGNVRVNGDLALSGGVTIGGDLTVSNGLRLHEKDLFLRKGTDEENGLGWYGSDKLFGSDYAPDGPVLYGANGGALAVNRFGQHEPILTWTNADGPRVGIGTTTPGARLSLGSDSANSKLLLRDTGSGSGIGMGASSDQFRFFLNGPGFFPKFSFLNSANGTEVFSISDQGLVRIGPSAQYYVPATSENLRILRGRIAGPTGGITTGTGFTVTKTGTGAYTVTFTPAFAGEPTITATPQVGLARLATVTNVGSSSAQFRTWDNAGNAIDQDFHFIAIGPR